ncbi:MAG: hypothetical protein M3436_01600 [Pseudomonadota bacterium]|nr:hypothetical protein [Pseudomonadota bacterium]
MEFTLAGHAGDFRPEPFYTSKLVGLVCNMDKTIGGKFEQGPAELKALAER